MVLINFYDRCFPNKHDPNKWCGGVWGKLPRRVGFSYDGNGIVDLHSEHQLHRDPKFRTADLKIGWLQENEAVNPKYFGEVRRNPGYFFDQLGFDYIYSYSHEFLNLDPRFRFQLGEGTWVNDFGIHPKSKLVSMIVSNKRITAGQDTRLEYKEKFKNQVDLYGRGFNEIQFKEEGLKDYMFSFAMENDVVDVMMTEKLADCFACGTIPIYLGSKGASQYWNGDGIIYLDEDFDISKLSADLYYSKMDAIKENFELVLERQVPVDYLFKEFF